MLSSASVTIAQSTWGDVMGSEKQVRALDRIRKFEHWPEGLDLFLSAIHSQKALSPSLRCYIE